MTTLDSFDKAIAIESPGVGWRMALASIIGFWAFYFFLNTLRMAIIGVPNQGSMVERRLAVVLGGICLTYMLYLVLRRFEHRSLGVVTGIAFALSVPLSVACAILNTYSFYGYRPLPSDQVEMEHLGDPRSAAIALIAEFACTWYFFICCWAIFYLALSFALRVREVERRAAEYRSAAQSAHLRALRYQINPHFLFNTLNSLSALVLRQRTTEADRMIVNLSNFFRSSLASDPARDLPLADEFRLQRLYLDIEQVRFPERLKVEISLPSDLENVEIPGLLLQPLVENAIKYGVASSCRPVLVRIEARRAPGDRLLLSVTDDGESGALAPATPQELSSQSVGLRNVSERLAARYDGAASIVFGPRQEGGFGVALTLPLKASA